MHTTTRYTPLSNLAPSTTSNTHLNKSFGSRILSYCPRLISPISWWHCLTLLYGSSTGKERSFRYIFLHLLLLILVGAWCFLYWMITDDAGRYLTLLTSVSGNKTDIIHGRQQFDQIFWRTAVKTICISITFGLINACGVSLAAIWRRRLCKEFYNIIFR